MKLGKLLGLALLLPAGCLSRPPADNPLMVRPVVGQVENPVLIHPGQPSSDAYAKVFESVYSVVDEYFGVAYDNRYDGRIIGHPKNANGIERFFLNGSTDPYQRLYATLQTIRYRCMVQIRSAEQGGYLVQVVVYRELRDDPRPLTTPSGTIFRDQATVDRQYAVVDSDVVAEAAWIPKGRETTIEDEMLKRIRRCQFE